MDGVTSVGFTYPANSSGAVAGMRSSCLSHVNVGIPRYYSAYLVLTVKPRERSMQRDSAIGQASGWPL
jgi:hypothetical protein